MADGLRTLLQSVFLLKAPHRSAARSIKVPSGLDAVAPRPQGSSMALCVRVSGCLGRRWYVLIAWAPTAWAALLSCSFSVHGWKAGLGSTLSRDEKPVALGSNSSIALFCRYLQQV